MFMHKLFDANGSRILDLMLKISSELRIYERDIGFIFQRKTNAAIAELVCVCTPDSRHTNIDTSGANLRVSKLFVASVIGNLAQDSLRDASQALLITYFAMCACVHVA